MPQEIELLVVEGGLYNVRQYAYIWPSGHVELWQQEWWDMRHDPDWKPVVNEVAHNTFVRLTLRPEDMAKLVAAYALPPAS